MKMVLPSKIVLSLIVLFGFQSLSNAQRAYLVFDMNSCGSCNKSAFLALQSSGVKSFKLLFSSSNTTPEQIEGFIENNPLLSSYSIEYDDEVFKKVKRGVKIFKAPQVVIIDQLDSILLQTSIDSIFFYKKKIVTLLSGWNEEVISIKRVRKLYGFNAINYENNMMYIANYGNTTKLLTYNFDSGVVDSIDLLAKRNFWRAALASENVNDVDLFEQQKFFKKYGLPYDAIGFAGYNATLSRGFIYDLFYIQYLADFNLPDTITPELKLYLFEYNTRTYEYRFYLYEDLEKQSKIYKDLQGLSLDFDYLNRLNDSTFMIGTRFNESSLDSLRSKKTYVYYEFNKDENRYKYNGRKLEIKTDSLISFTKERMNKRYFQYSSVLLPTFLIFKNSPFFYNHKTGQTYSIEKFFSGVVSIFDAQEREGKLELLVELGDDNLSLASIDIQTLNLESINEIGSLERNSNIVLWRDEIISINKTGDIIRFKRN